MRWLIAFTLAGCFNVSLDFTCQQDWQCVSGDHHGTCMNSRCVFSTDDLSGVTSPDLSGADLAGVDFSAADLSLALAPDLTGVDLNGADFTPAPDLAQASDLAGADLTPPDYTCALPQLLVTVENLDPGQGQVLRFHVPPFPSPLQPCTPLTGSGNLGRYPEAVTPFGSGQIAVAGRDQLSIVDTNNDTVTNFWQQNVNALFPIDVATISNGGDNYIAVADANIGDSYASWLDVYKIGAGSGPTNEWWHSDLGLSSVYGLTIDPLDATKLLVADDRAVNPVWEETLDPFAASNWTSDRGNATGGISLMTMHTIAGLGLTAWVTGNGVYYGWEYSGGPSIVGPTSCVCSSPLHAIFYEGSLKVGYVLCDSGTPNSRFVQRARYDSVSSQCAPAFNGSTLPGNQRLTHLGYIYQ
jgi:hypothetical protein